MKLLVIACIILSFARALPNQAPIIGIYTQSDQSDEPTSVSDGAKAEVSNYSYIAASYVKYIQMSGAQVVPIFAYSNQSYFDQLLPKINGVLFPGTSTSIQEATPISISELHGPRTLSISSNMLWKKIKKGTFFQFGVHVLACNFLPIWLVAMMIRPSLMLGARSRSETPLKSSPTVSCLGTCPHRWDTTPKTETESSTLIITSPSLRITLIAANPSRIFGQLKPIRPVLITNAFCLCLEPKSIPSTEFSSILRRIFTNGKCTLIDRATELRSFSIYLTSL